MSDIDYKEIWSESARMLVKWRDANDGYLDREREDSFEYGFELGWRLAKGEVIE